MSTKLEVARIMRAMLDTLDRIALILAEGRPDTEALRQQQRALDEAIGELERAGPAEGEG
jgi:hypothetical protein